MMFESAENFASELEALECIRRAQAGDAAAMAEVIARNSLMLHKFARKYERCGSEHEDLFSAGIVEVEKAVMKFDFERKVTVGIVLITAAKRGMQHHLYRDRAIHFGLGIDLRKRKVCAIADRLKSECREVTPETVAAESGLPVSAVQKVMKLELPIASMDVPDEEGGPDLSNTIAAERSPGIEFEIANDTAVMMRELAKLQQPDRMVLEHRFGLNGKKVMKIREIAAQLRCTTGNVSFIQTRAIGTLRKLMNPAETCRN